MIFSYDTETELITDEQPIPDVVCMSWAVEGASGVMAPAEGLDTLQGALEAEAEIVGHNVAFDFSVCMKARPELEPLIWAAYDAGRVFDTMIAAQLDDIARGIFRGTRKGAYTLARLAVDYCSIHLEKEDTWRLRYGELKGLPISAWPPEAVEYARLDAATTYDVRKAMHEPPDTRAQSAHAWWLHLVAKHGVRTDPDRVTALFDKVTTEAASIIRELLPLGWVSFDKDGTMHRHPSKVKARMVELGKIKPTKKGDVSVDEEACENSGDPVLMRYSRLSKLLDILNKDSGYLLSPYVRCSYGLAESGRSTSWGPNLQNLKTELEWLNA